MGAPAPGLFTLREGVVGIGAGGTTMIRRLAPAALALAVACSSSEQGARPCDPVAQTGCGTGLTCELVAGAGAACFAPVVVAGTVTDPIGLASVAGARVVALDANRAPISSVAVTGTAGAFQLAVRAAREPDGTPVATPLILRADAQGYETFPGGIRPALPIDLSTAVASNGRWVVTGPLTALQLLPAEGGGAWITGTVARAQGVAPPLVVAEPVGAGTVVTGVADRDGSFAVFNLAQGVRYDLKAYARGANHPTVTTAALSAGANAVSIGAPATAQASASVEGGLIFNNGASPPMQVTLVVASTYVTTLDRGESPPGLTAEVAAGANRYALAGVPDGDYVVLAAFGRDGKVRDVSGGGNTAAPRITIAGGALQGPPPGFKIRPAVELLAIGGAPVGADPVVVVSTAAPEFRWVTRSAYSSAQTYRVLVFDAYGRAAWSRDVSSDAPATYAGAALVPGRPYQLRILAISETVQELVDAPLTVTQLSQTEDVLGVFTYRP
jgi:hypothetical protein